MSAAFGGSSSRLFWTRTFVHRRTSLPLSWSSHTRSDAVEKSTNRPGGKPKRDMVGTDGQRLSVGDASIQIVTMPGHTPGTLSYLFEVRDNGKPLRVACKLVASW